MPAPQSSVVAHWAQTPVAPLVLKHLPFMQFSLLVQQSPGLPTGVWQALPAPQNAQGPSPEQWAFVLH